MGYRFLVDAVVTAHLLFIGFVVFGGLAAAVRPQVALVHLPCVLWAVILEWRGLVCPLTPLENLLRAKAGTAGYHTGFIEHYLTGIIYPGGLTQGIRFLLGAGALLINLVIYLLVIAKISKKRPPLQ